MKSLETAIERAFVAKLDEMDIMHRKLNGEGRRGWPDRMIVLPLGQVVFIEFKRPGGERTALQKHIHAMLQARGHRVETFDSSRAALAYLMEVIGA